MGESGDGEFSLGRSQAEDKSVVNTGQQDNCIDRPTRQ